MRKTLELTQQEFGERIGIKRNSVALIENGRNTSDQTIFAICREFNVREEWLREGTGEMFKAAPNTALDALAEEYGYSRRDYVVVEKFSNLSRRERDVILDFLADVAAGCADIDSPEFPAENPGKIDIEAEVAAYRRSLELQEKASGKSSALPGINAATSKSIVYHENEKEA